MRAVIEKPLLFLRRFLVLPVFLMLVLAVSMGELFYLVKLGKKDVFAGEKKLTKVVIGEAAENDYKEIYLSTVATGADARPMLIKKYLEKYNSPLVPYSDLIFELSETYGYEYYWIVAIAQQESNLCKKIPDDSHNCWGYGIHKKGTLRFDNYELALRSFASYLKTEYFDKGYNSPELMMQKYCPSSNGSWAFGVNQFIEEIKSGGF